MSLLSHRFGLLPVWLWINTLSPTCKGANGRVLVQRFNSAYIAFLQRAFRSHASFQRPAISGLSNAEISLEIDGRVSLSRRPKSTSAGDSLQLGSGVLRRVNMARTMLSVSGGPSEKMLFIKRRLAVLTSTSARPFEKGR